MKIEYSIMSSDSNNLYLDFWEPVSKIWKNKFNITPILYYIDENQTLEINEDYGKVIRLKPIDGIPVYLQCLWVRYWGFSNFLDDVCILSDIDMLPMSKKYFVDNISNIEENKYVHLNPCINSYGMLPSCYHVSKGINFKKILQLHDNWEDSIKHLYSLNIGNDPGYHLSGKNHWFADERFSSNKILEYRNSHPDEIILLDREGGQNGFRVDRGGWGYEPELVKQDYYYDSHSIRPYSVHKSEINGLIDKILF
jgi:hypothetical protein